jgi:uncharacterized protein (DUF1697 family)
MPVFIALNRGVGGHKKLKMADVKTAARGFQE